MPTVVSTVAAATSAGSTASTTTAAVSAAPKTMSTVAKGVGKGPGSGLVTVLDQMQSVAATGAMAPADMPGFTAVAGAVGWTTQMPVPFWNDLGELPLQLPSAAYTLDSVLATQLPALVQFTFMPGRIRSQRD